MLKLCTIELWHDHRPSSSLTFSAHHQSWLDNKALICGSIKNCDILVLFCSLRYFVSLTFDPCGQHIYYLDFSTTLLCIQMVVGKESSLFWLELIMAFVLCTEWSLCNNDCNKYIHLFKGMLFFCAGHLCLRQLLTNTWFDFTLSILWKPIFFLYSTILCC